MGGKLIQPGNRAELVSELRKVLSDRISLIQSVLSVPYGTKTVPFVLWPIQRDYLENKTHADIILKSRQIGMTTAVCADLFIDAITIPHLTVLTVAQNDKAAETVIMPKYALFYSLLPDMINVKGHEIWIKPKLDGDSRSLMYFSEINGTPLESRIRVGTAGSVATGHGETIHRFHGTEVAYWPEGTAAIALAGVEGAMSSGGTRRILESTANGTDSFFYGWWEKSRRNETGYKCFFFPWFRDPNASLKHNSPEAIEAGLEKLTLDTREARMKLQYNLSMEQMRWYKLRKMRMGDVADQETACDDITCFLVSGSGVFDPLVITHYAANVRDPIEESDGLKVWLPSRPVEEYIIAVDPASGDTKDADYSVAVVLNHKTLEHCATLRGRWDSRTFSQYVCELAYQYNGALVAIERNMGEAVALVIDQYLNYGNLFRDESGQIGWRTTRDNKQFMVDSLKSIINSRNLITYDGDFISELRSFVEKRTPAGNTTQRAERGKHDDIIMSMALAATVRSMGVLSGATSVVSYR